MPSYYDILGVTGDTDEKGIRQAYRKLARQWHPDVNPGDSEAEAKFKQINEAYEVLSDPEKRVKYDKYGNDWKHADERDKARASQGRGDFTYWFSGSPDFDGQMGGVSGGAFDDILSGFRRGRSRPQRLRYDVDVTLEEAFRGTTRIVDVPILSGEGSKRIEVKIPLELTTAPRCAFLWETGRRPRSASTYGCESIRSSGVRAPTCTPKWMSRRWTQSWEGKPQCRR